jgi:hypothetical protein
MAKTAAASSQSADETGSHVTVVPPAPSPLQAEEAEKTASPVTAQRIELPGKTPELVLSAGIEPSRSWFSANKYIVLVLLVIGAAAAAILLVR